MPRRGHGAALGVSLLVTALLALAGFAAPAMADGPTVSGGDPPVVGAQLTATPAADSDQIGWVACDASGSPASGPALVAPAASHPGYALQLSDAYVCAEDQPTVLGVPAGAPSYSAPIGPVEGLPASAYPRISTGAGAVAQGQVLTVSNGGWGAGASIADQWEDCNAAGGACSPVGSGGTGSSYTVTRADAGHTIVVLQTATAGDRSSSVSTAPTGTASANAPTNSTPPSISGAAQVGNTLTASTGSWSNDPTGYSYAWARCSGGTCRRVTGADNRTYSLGSGDVGDSLEVFVTASVLSVESTAYPSAPTNIVSGANGTGISSGSGPSKHKKSKKKSKHKKTRLGRVTSVMQWTFRYTPSYTEVLGLGVKSPGNGATITIHCAGRGCPYARHQWKVARVKTACGAKRRKTCRRVPRSFDIRRGLNGHKLRVGARLTVSITRSHAVGKYYGFLVRRRRAPAVLISCLAPHSSRPGRGCRAG